MTIAELVRGRSTLDQYDIMMRADVMWKVLHRYIHRFGGVGVGRYYGGQLTEAQIAFLDPPKSKPPQQVPAQHGKPADH